MKLTKNLQFPGSLAVMALLLASALVFAGCGQEQSTGHNTAQGQMPGDQNPRNSGGRLEPAMASPPVKPAAAPAAAEPTAKPEASGGASQAGQKQPISSTNAAPEMSPGASGGPAQGEGQSAPTRKF